MQFLIKTAIALMYPSRSCMYSSWCLEVTTVATHVSPPDRAPRPAPCNNDSGPCAPSKKYIRVTLGNETPVDRTDVQTIMADGEAAKAIKSAAAPETHSKTSRLVCFDLKILAISSTLFLKRQNTMARPPFSWSSRSSAINCLVSVVSFKTTDRDWRSGLIVMDVENSGRPSDEVNTEAYCGWSVAVMQQTWGQNVANSWIPWKSL